MEATPETVAQFVNAVEPVKMLFDLANTFARVRDGDIEQMYDLDCEQLLEHVNDILFQLMGKDAYEQAQEMYAKGQLGPLIDVGRVG